MTGGMAFLYDPEGRAETVMNMETLVTCRVTVEHWHDLLHGLVARHHQETGSRRAADILQHWDHEVGSFLQVCPREMLNKLEAPIGVEEQAVPAE